MRRLYEIYDKEGDRIAKRKTRKKKILRREKSNLINAYKNAVKKGHLTEKESKNGINEVRKDYKKHGV